MSGRSKPTPVLDASAVLALLQDEPGADKLWDLLPLAVISAVNVAEVLSKLISRGMPHSEAMAALGALNLEVAEFTPAEAVVSASFVRKGVSLGDRCFLAAAQVRGVGWTSDRELAAFAGAHLPRLEFLR